MRQDVPLQPSGGCAWRLLQGRGASGRHWALCWHLGPHATLVEPAPRPRQGGLPSAGWVPPPCRPAVLTWSVLRRDSRQFSEPDNYRLQLLWQDEGAFYKGATRMQQHWVRFSAESQVSFLGSVRGWDLPSPTHASSHSTNRLFAEHWLGMRGQRSGGGAQPWRALPQPHEAPGLGAGRCQADKNHSWGLAGRGPLLEAAV